MNTRMRVTVAVIAGAGTIAAGGGSTSLEDCKGSHLMHTTALGSRGLVVSRQGHQYRQRR